MRRFTALAGAMLAASACATLSPRAAIESRFVEFGFSQERASCLAAELDERLDRSDMNSVADFLDGLNAAATAGESLDALLSIDNPRAASAIGAAGLACAFSG